MVGKQLNFFLTKRDTHEINKLIIDFDESVLLYRKCETENQRPLDLNSMNAEKKKYESYIITNKTNINKIQKRFVEEKKYYVIDTEKSLLIEYMPSKEENLEGGKTLVRRGRVYLPGREDYKNNTEYQDFKKWTSKLFRRIKENMAYFDGNFYYGKDAISKKDTVYSQL